MQHSVINYGKRPTFYNIPKISQSKNIYINSNWWASDPWIIYISGSFSVQIQKLQVNSINSCQVKLKFALRCLCICLYLISQCSSLRKNNLSSRQFLYKENSLTLFTPMLLTSLFVFFSLCPFFTIFLYISFFIHLFHLYSTIPFLP